MKQARFYLWGVLVLLTIPFLANVNAESTSYSTPNGTVIDAGDELVVELGTIPAGYWVSVSHDSDNVPIDISIMTRSDWDSYTSATVLTNGTELATTFSSFNWLVDRTDEYVIIYDNSDRFAEGADGLVAATLDKGYGDDGATARVTDTTLYDYENRLYIQPNSMFRYDFGAVGPGSHLTLNVDLEDWFSGGVDAFVVEQSNVESFLAGEETWNRNASFFDISYNNWYFEPDYLASWTVFIENGPRGESNQMAEAAVVDVHFEVNPMDGLEIIKTSRMIETGEAWHGELGLRGANTVLDFVLDLEGFTSEVDVLILNTSEATRYMQGENVSVLGHASLINTDTWDSWSYTFPEENAYSIILDNTNSPVGGGAETRPIHAEITVDEATLTSTWLGWTSSRHFIDDDSYLTFDLGELFVDDEIYYSVSGRNFGSGFLPSFDVVLMNYVEYDRMLAGESPNIITNGSDLDTWLALLPSYEIEVRDEYKLVIEVGDKIPGGSSDDGAWMMDFIVKSSGPVTLEQAMDQNYWLTATHHTQVAEGTTSAPNTDGQRNLGEVQSGESFSGGGGGIFAVCCGLPIVLLFVRRRRRKIATQRLDDAVQSGVANALASQQPPIPAMNAPAAVQPPATPPVLAPTTAIAPITVSDYTRLQGGGEYITSATGGVVYVVNGESWAQNPDGSFTQQ